MLGAAAVFALPGPLPHPPPAFSCKVGREGDAVSTHTHTHSNECTNLFLSTEGFLFSSCLFSALYPLSPGYLSRRSRVGAPILSPSLLFFCVFYVSPLVTRSQRAWDKEEYCDSVHGRWVRLSYGRPAEVCVHSAFHFEVRYLDSLFHFFMYFSLYTRRCCASQCASLLCK